MATPAGYYLQVTFADNYGRGVGRGYIAAIPDPQTILSATTAGLVRGIGNGMQLGVVDGIRLSEDEADLLSLTGFATPSDRPDVGARQGYALGAAGIGEAFDEGVDAGMATVPVVAAQPTSTAPIAIALSNITPDPFEPPGSPGAFSIDFRVARLQPISFDVAGGNGAQISIEVSFGDRNETYVALDFDGVFRWPFDVPSQNTIGDLSSDPVHVTLLPRGGWPPTMIRMRVAIALPSG